MIQGKRDVDTVLAMGVMDDVSIIPQPAGGTSLLMLCMDNYLCYFQMLDIHPG